ncbi:MAG: hypothetical protein O3B84_05695, partial [Chloroflexi bacterium]|nr:hypothetical protein [Chloroflexota bacterium]
LVPHQLENAALARAVLEYLRGSAISVPDAAIESGFRDVDWPGRLEVVRDDPLVVVDGAHNPYSAMRLAEAVLAVFPNKRVTLVIGISIDKDINAIAQEISSIAAGAIATASRHARSASPDALADALWEAGVPVRPEPTVARALDRALQELTPGGMVLVTGSLFVVAEAREHMLGIIPEQIEPPTANNAVKTLA